MPRKPSAKNEAFRPTSLKMPEPLFKAVHIRAIEEGIEFRELIWKALELYLKTNAKK